MNCNYPFSIQNDLTIGNQHFGYGGLQIRYTVKLSSSFKHVKIPIDLTKVLSGSL